MTPQTELSTQMWGRGPIPMSCPPTISCADGLSRSRPRRQASSPMSRPSASGCAQTPGPRCAAHGAHAQKRHWYEQGEAVRQAPAGLPAGHAVDRPAQRESGVQLNRDSGRRDARAPAAEVDGLRQHGAGPVLPVRLGAVRLHHIDRGDGCTAWYEHQRTHS